MGFVALPLLVACGADPAPHPSPAADVTSAPTEPSIFVDGAPAAGLDFVYFNGMSGEHYFNEMMGGGAALFDYDNDGDLDVFFVQGQMLGRAKSAADAVFSLPDGVPLTDRLYRNDLEPGTSGEGTLRFTDVTAASGITSAGYGMGVAVGDYDNDGWVDLYVTNFESNNLLRNRGDGTFEDVTVAASAEDPHWSVVATFLDYDHDGWLDLYIGNYVQYSLASHTPCPLPSGILTYCGPGAFRPEIDTLLRNRGDGTFEDVSIRSGVRDQPGTTLGAVTADFNGDRWIDLYVANDLMSNRLWINQRDGTFVDEGLLAGVAVNAEGQPEAGMGVDAGDFDNDGDIDIILAHLIQQTNTLYENDGTGLFEDASTRSGLGPPTLLYTTFGIGWIDFDNDSWLDVLSVSGAVVGLEPLIRDGDLYPLHQTNQVFHNLRNGRFEEVTDRVGGVFSASEVSRGAAFGDLDNDGDTDVVVVNSNGPTRMLLNQVGQDSFWIGLEIVGEHGPVNGAEVVLHRPDGPPVWRRVHTDGSYASASDPRVLVGLGDSPAVTRVEVRWPDGTTEQWTDVRPGRYQTLRQGEGEPARSE